MRKKNFFHYLFISLATAILVTAVIVHPSKPILPPKKKGPVYVENKTDRINIMLFCQSSDYFLYRGSAMGFQYELLKIMGDSLGKEIKFTYTSDPEEVTSHLFTSDFDIIAYDIEPEQAGKEDLLHSVPHSQSFPVLLANAKVADDSTRLHTLNTAYLPDHKPFNIIQDSLNFGTWKLIRSDSTDAEELVDLLQDDSIDYVIVDYNTAIMLEPFYSNVNMVKTVGKPYDRSWILNPANKEFNQQLNEWLKRFKQSERYNKLCDKYLHPHSRVLRGASYEHRRGTISSYDKIIKRYAKNRGLDWRFVSSIIYQESQFSAHLVGFGGSYGIMQMMPGTAAALGIDSTSSVSQQIAAGIGLIASFNRMFKNVEDDLERMYFVAASYNAGAGHIIDARALCRKYGGNPDIWLDVEPYLIKKSDRRYYSDPVVKCGYYPGKHTVYYTHAVMNRYNAYRMSYPEN